MHWKTSVRPKEISIFLSCIFIELIHIPFITISDVQMSHRVKTPEWCQRHIGEKWNRNSDRLVHENNRLGE
jgi:hypothetical protein